MNTKIKTIVVPLFIALSLILGACAEQTPENSDSIDGAVEEGTEDVEQGAEDLEEDAEDAAGDARDGLEEGVEDTGNAIEDLGEEIPSSEE